MNPDRFPTKYTSIFKRLHNNFIGEIKKEFTVSLVVHQPFYYIFVFTQFVYTISQLPGVWKVTWPRSVTYSKCTSNCFGNIWAVISSVIFCFTHSEYNTGAPNAPYPLFHHINATVSAASLTSLSVITDVFFHVVASLYFLFFFKLWILKIFPGYWNLDLPLSHSLTSMTVLCLILTFWQQQISLQCCTTNTKSLIQVWCTSLFSPLATQKVPLQLSLSEQLTSHDIAKLPRNSTLHLKLRATTNRLSDVFLLHFLIIIAMSQEKILRSIKHHSNRSERKIKQWYHRCSDVMDDCGVLKLLFILIYIKKHVMAKMTEFWWWY